MSLRKPPPTTRRIREAHQSRSATVRAAAAAPSRRQVSRWERDRQQSMVLLLAFAGLILLVATALAVGWVVENVVQAGDVVAEVAGERITTSQVVDEMRPSVAAIDTQLRRAAAGAGRATAGQAEQQKRGLPDQALNALVEDRLLQREAARRGITVTPDEVDARVREDIAEVEAFSTPQATPTGAPEGSGASLALSPSAATTPTPVPTLDEATQREAQARQLERIGISEQRYRELVRRELLREKVQKAVGADVPGTQEQVRARHILVDEEPKAREVLQRLEAGEGFAEVATEVSMDPGSKAKGGDLGWFPRGQMNAPFEAAAFALQPGQRSGVVRSPNGYHIIEVVERDAERPLSESELEAMQARAFSTWLSERRASPEVRFEFASGERDWTLRHIGLRP